MKYLKCYTDCWFTLLVLLFVLEIKKNNNNNLKWSVNWLFLEFFLPQPSNPKSEKKSGKSTNKNNSGLNMICASLWENLTKLHANNKGVDQPVHPHSLISVIVIDLLESIIPKLVSGKISTF